MKDNKVKLEFHIIPLLKMSSVLNRNTYSRILASTNFPHVTWLWQLLYYYSLGEIPTGVMGL